MFDAIWICNRKLFFENYMKLNPMECVTYNNLAFWEQIGCCEMKPWSKALRCNMHQKRAVLVLKAVRRWIMLPPRNAIAICKSGVWKHGLRQNVRRFLSGSAKREKVNGALKCRASNIATTYSLIRNTDLLPDLSQINPQVCCTRWGWE